MPLRSSLAVVVLFAGLAQARAADKIDFEKQIKPILEKSCLKCHGEKKAEASLRLDTRELALKGGDLGPSLAPKDAEDSELYIRITLPADDFSRMPNEGDPLTKAETDLIRDWINQGAEWPESVVLKIPGALPEQKLPEIAKLPLTKEEQQTMAEIRKLGGQVMELAQNDNRLSVAYHLADGKVTDAHLAPLKGIQKRLYELNLRGTEITDAGLVHLKEMPQLTRLHLEKTKITDDGLEHLKGLPSLEYLNVYDTAVTDAGLARVKDLKNLQKVYIWQSKATIAGVADLKKARPELEIIPDLVVEQARAEKERAEAMKRAEEAKRVAQEEQQKAEAAQKQAAELAQQLAAARKQAEEAQKNAEAAKKRAEELHKQSEQAKKNAEEAQKKAAEAKKAADEAAKQVQAKT